MPVNRRDPHGYYAEIGVPPWASDEEVRRAVRSLYRRLHPDTGAEPDTERLQRVKLIAEVLLDPRSRDAYNRTPPGRRLLDKVYRAELAGMDFSGLDADDLEEMLAPSGTGSGTGKWYDYLAVDRREGDMHLAQRWYTAFLHVAPLAGYRRRIKVLIHDGPPFFHHETAVMAVPRRWEPSTALAFGLFTVAAGVSRASFVVAAS